MTRQGVVLDALNALGCPEAFDLPPFQVGRLTGFADPALYAYVAHLREHGIDAPIVLTSETFGASMDPAVWAAVAGEIADNCEPSLWVLGNEPDAYQLSEPSSASWIMHPDLYAQFWMVLERSIRSRHPDARLGVAGQVSGQPWLTGVYLREVKAAGGHPAVCDLHLYGKTAAEVAEIMPAYRALSFGIPFSMLEWNRAAEEISEYVAMLDAEGFTDACYMAWHATDIDGLHNHDGAPTPEYDAYVAALNAPPPPDEEEPSVSGIEKFLTEHPELGPIWTADGEEGTPIVVNSRMRVAGLANHTLIEMDGEVWPHLIDQSLFPPQS